MGSLSRFFEALSGRERLAAFVAVLVAIVLLATLWTGGLLTTVVVSVIILGLLWATRGIWAPASYGRGRLRITSLTLVLTVATAALGSGGALKAALVRTLAASVGVQLDAAKTPDRFITALVLTFVLLAVFVINYLARDTTAMGQHPNPLKQEFPGRQYREQLRSFCSLLRSHLLDLNHKTNWAEAYFVPLDAEVEVATGGTTIRKITGLLSAVRSDRQSRVFLILGDPGAGKSVALRKLAAELLDEVDRSGRVPIYVNLKEWNPERQWCEEYPPSVQDLYDFILKNLKDRSDVFAAEFLDLYFKPMLENGRFFMLFDSFDEIPAVLDVGESSWLIDELSSVFTRFFSGADQTRGVLASRLYRRPNLALPDSTKLEIRPFTELQIAEALRRSPSFPEASLTDRFRNRPDLVPIARNPFTAALIRTYTTEHNALPPNQFELYQSYVSGRLRAAVERLQQKGLTATEVVSGAIEIASMMFRTSQLGLEAPLSDLVQSLPNYWIRDIANVLEFARLARIGAGEEQRVSFVHRRFNEYFVAQRLVVQPVEVQLDSIPADSRWRDALVLYCQVADEQQAKAIAAFCWSGILPVIAGTLAITDEGYLRAVHCLRFLRDAFRARPACIADFRGKLAAFIEREVRDADLLSAKIALEATGLLSDQQIEKIIVCALERGNQWISQTALTSCRHLPTLGSTVEKELETFIESMPLRLFLRLRRELLFSLSLSDSFRGLRRFCYLRGVDNRLFLCAVVALVFTAPIAVAMGGVYALFALLTQRLQASRRAILIFRLSVAALVLMPLVTSVFMKADSEVARRERISSKDVEFQSMPYLFGAERVLRSLVVAGHSVPYPMLSRAAPARSVTDALVFCGYLLLALSMIPMTSLYRVSEKMRAVTWNVAGLTILTLLGAGALMWLMITVLGWLPGYVWLIMPPIIGVSFLAWVCYLLKGPALVFVSMIRDRRELQKMRRHIVRERFEIERDLAALHTEWGRLRYVCWLRDSKTVPRGMWSEGVPYHGHDQASTLLAQMEERWLNLDR